MSATNTWRARLVTFCAAAAALIVTAPGQYRRRRQVSKLKSCSGRQDRDWPSPRVAGRGGGVAVVSRRRRLGQAEMAAFVLADRHGVRDATSSHRALPQLVGNPSSPGPIAEGPYLNVSTPSLHSRRGDGRPVLVWIHGRSTQDAAATTTAPSSRRRALSSSRSTTGGASASSRTRALAAGRLNRQLRLDGPAGSVRWIQRNIAQFGGDPDNVTIAGQSAGGLSVLAHLVSRDSRGLFQRAIVQSGAFALTQRSLADAEAFGKTFAESELPDETAECLRACRSTNSSTSSRPQRFRASSMETCSPNRSGRRRGGRFTRVPILNGINHDEEFLFVAALGPAGATGCSWGCLDLSGELQSAIAAVLGAGHGGAALSRRVPVAAYPLPRVASPRFVSDGIRVPSCRSTAGAPRADLRVPVQRRHRTASLGTSRALPATIPRSSYLFRPAERAVPSGVERRPGGPCRQHAQHTGGWNGDPSSAALPWPSFDNDGRVLSPAASATGRRRERGVAPLRVLVRRLATASSEGMP